MTIEGRMRLLRTALLACVLAFLLASPAFAFKLLFLMLAGINACAFEFIAVPRHLPKLGEGSLPRSFRYAGLASLTLWTLTIAFGRLIPYLPEWS